MERFEYLIKKRAGALGLFNKVLRKLDKVHEEMHRAVEDAFDAGRLFQREDLTMRFGFDLHGVLDAKPQLFSVLTRLLVEAGHEVHVLTGPPVNDELRGQLDSLGVVWTHLFSIVDELHKLQNLGALQEKMHQDEKGRWWSHPYDWDRVKGDYCAKHKIDLHFDDSDHYQYFFTTPYARFLSRDSHRIQKTIIPNAEPGTPPCGGFA